MEIEINDEKYQKEVGKLKQLDRIEFRQKRIFYVSQLNNIHTRLGLEIIMGMVVLAISFIAYLFSDTASMISCGIGIWFLIGAMYNHYKNDKLIENNMMEHLKEWLNINDVT